MTEVAVPAKGIKGKGSDSTDDEDFVVTLEKDGGEQVSVKVKKNETMGQVKRRMSVTMGVSDEQMAALMGIDSKFTSNLLLLVVSWSFLRVCLWLQVLTTTRQSSRPGKA